MDTYVIRRPSGWANAQELEVTAAKSAKIGDTEMPERVRWIRTYVVREPDGRLGTYCVYQARDVASLRELERRVGMVGSDIHPVIDTVIVRPDPTPVGASAAGR